MIVNGGHVSSAAARWRRRGLALCFAGWLLLACYAASAPVYVHASNATLIRLVSGSMAPTYPAGSVLLLHPLGTDVGVQVHDVITFRRAAGLPVTHRVVERVNLGGTIALRTQGDANPTPDEQLTFQDAVVGRVTGALPSMLLGSLWLQGRWQRLLIFGVPLVIIILAELRHLMSFRGERQRRLT